MRTHTVFNQPPELPEYNLFSTDPVLPSAVDQGSAGWATDVLSEFGAQVGRRQVVEWGFLANRNEPVLHSHDRFGHRADQVEFHPAWHELMSLAISHGVHSLHWEHERPGSHVARAALMYIDSQIEQGHGCPIAMTSSVVPSLRVQPDLASEVIPRLTSRHYDGRFAPPEEKTGMLMGMGMTEKQGGSDVRANTTLAVPDATGYRITGHKWFTSAPMCDAFLILAQAPGGLSCFYLPRWTPDGEVNSLRLLRLKDKLGNRSNASAEIEFESAWAVLVGEEGRGVRTIIEMVNGTRLDTGLGSAAIMRQAVTQALHHVSHREAFGKRLVEQTLMRSVLADLEIEVEAATLMMMRVAGAFDRANTDEGEALVKRIITPVAKYWVTKRCTAVVQEALECVGGNGYVEESMMPRLFRESPLNAVWEGSGNVIALDLIRAMNREPEAVDAFADEVGAARGADQRFDDALDRLQGMIGSVSDPEAEARRLIESMALVLAGSLAIRQGSDALATGFVATRLGGDWGATFGTLPHGVAVDRLVDIASASIVA